MFGKKNATKLTKTDIGL